MLKMLPVAARRCSGGHLSADAGVAAADGTDEVGDVIKTVDGEDVYYYDLLIVGWTRRPAGRSRLC